MTSAQAVGLGLLLLGSVSPAAITLAATPEPAHGKPRRTAPAHTAHSAPDVTGTIPKPQDATPPAIAAAPDDDVVPPPFKLPAASRARVRACGLAWFEMKNTGKTGDDDWRDFAEKCFIAKDPPPASP